MRCIDSAATSGRPWRRPPLWLAPRPSSLRWWRARKERTWPRGPRLRRMSRPAPHRGAGRLCLGCSHRGLLGRLAPDLVQLDIRVVRAPLRRAPSRMHAGRWRLRLLWRTWSARTTSPVTRTGFRDRHAGASLVREGGLAKGRRRQPCSYVLGTTRVRPEHGPRPCRPRGCEGHRGADAACADGCRLCRPAALAARAAASFNR